MKPAWQIKAALSFSVVNLITTEKDKKYEPVARMADAIIDLALERGDCLPCDLQAKGFSSNEVAALWHFAHSLATVELKHMESRGLSFSHREARYA